MVCVRYVVCVVGGLVHNKGDMHTMDDHGITGRTPHTAHASRPHSHGTCDDLGNDVVRVVWHPRIAHHTSVGVVAACV